MAGCDIDASSHELPVGSFAGGKDPLFHFRDQSRKVDSPTQSPLRAVVTGSMPGALITTLFLCVSIAYGQKISASFSGP